jgi:hypothetical protein
MGWSEIAAWQRFLAIDAILEETQEKLLNGGGAMHPRGIGRLTTFTWLVKMGVRGGAAR